MIFDQRTKALVDPDGYKTDRNAQFEKMTGAVEATYKDVMEELKNTGMPSIQAQQMAINAAAATKAAQEAILESLFPSGSTAVAMQADGVRAGKFTGMLTAPSASMSAPRRAPRRSTKKKK